MFKYGYAITWITNFWRQNINYKMIKIVLFMTVWMLTEASYVTRMNMLNKMRSPVAFRPGVVLQRPLYQQRLPPASRRAPYIMYRNPPPRYAIKHVNSAPTRNLFTPFKTTRIPVPSATPEYDFVKSASSQVIHADGAIHTIPAPNLSLSEKPIVVIDTSENNSSSDTSEPPKPTYEVTEKTADQPIYQPNVKIEHPVGFSRASTLSVADLQSIMRNNAALQIASEYGLPIHLSQTPAQMSQPSVIPQQFSFQGFNGLPEQHDYFHREGEGIVLPQNALFQPDPVLMHRLHSQLLQYPPVDFIPFTINEHAHVTQTPETQTTFELLQNEQIIKQLPSSFVPTDTQKHIVQRETQESSLSSLFPHAFTVKNVSENLIDIDVTTTSTPQNRTLDIVTTEIQLPTTTAQNIDESKEDQETTPLYYAQIGQSVGNAITKGFYTAVNDVRKVVARNNVEKTEDKMTKENYTSTTPSTTTQREIKALFTQNEKKVNKMDELTNLIASPFEKTAESVNVAYTLLRSNEKQAKVNEDGEVFAGQLVEAKISEDQDFNKEKAILAARPPVRLFAVTERKITQSPQQVTVVKAKIPPKSKLTFDDKTGEPVLRVYASYIDNPTQRQLVTTKLASMKHKEATRKHDSLDWKVDNVKNIDAEVINDKDPMAQFGIKIKSRSDDYMPIFEDYEE